VTIALERPVGTTDPTTLVDPEVMNRLVRRVTTDHPEINEDTARRIVGQAAAFLAASGQQPGRFLAPSKAVDIGWHTFILHTVEYTEFCERIAGRYLHHVPDEEEEQEAPGGTLETRRRTLAAIKAAGYSVDPELWPAADGDCTQCHAGCTDSPNGGKK
jgi:hypothetical protein